MKTIAIVNQKGGVGKTTTAENLGYALALKNKRVLFIDLDSQCNLTASVFSGDYNDKTSFDILKSPEIANFCIRSTDDAFIIPSSPNLVLADITITGIGREYKLKEAAETINEFDFIILDTPPNTGIVTINALVAADYAVIPAGADSFSLQGLSALSGTIEDIRKYTNSNLEILGVLLTKFNRRTVLSRDVEETLRNGGIPVFETTIRESIAVKEAQAKHKCLFNYSPNCSAAKDYLDFCNEIVVKI